MSQTDPQWADVDSWWGDFVQRQESGLIELHELVDDRNQMWEQSGTQFEKDPLVVDWTESTPQAGLLRDCCIDEQIANAVAFWNDYINANTFIRPRQRNQTACAMLRRY